MATRTERIELRADSQRERRIRYAAELSHQSVSAFVLEAAAERAESVIGAASITSVPSAFFAKLWAALEKAPRANPALRRRARRPRRVDQR